MQNGMFKEDENSKEGDRRGPQERREKALGLWAEGGGKASLIMEEKTHTHRIAHTGRVAVEAHSRKILRDYFNNKPCILQQDITRLTTPFLSWEQSSV